MRKYCDFSSWNYAVSSAPYSLSIYILVRNLSNNGEKGYFAS